MDHIVITGGTGVIGRRSVDALITAGHRVTGVTRSGRGRRQLEARGARAVAADVFDPDSLASAFAGADAVVNLLTHLPAADASRRSRSFSSQAPGTPIRSAAGRWVSRLTTASAPANAGASESGSTH